MKIGITAFAADAGKSGIGQYIRQMLTLLPVVTGDKHSFVVFMSMSDIPELDPCARQVQVIGINPLWAKPLLNIVWHLLVFPWLLRRQRCQLALFLAGNRRLALTPGIPSVGVIHDLSQLHVLHKYDRFRTAYVLKLLPLLMRRLDVVVAVSHSTSRDLTGFARVAADKIQVIHNGADVKAFAGINRDQARLRVQQAFGFDGPYILYTARLEHPGKNHVGLLRAFAKLKQNCNLPHKLILAGGRWNGVEVIDDLIDTLGLRDEVLTPGFVAAELLPDLTGGADLFVFPSLFEGFGIPLLEAMAAGTPICASDVSSIPEVVGDAGLLFKADDHQDMARSMQRLLTDEQLAEDCCTRGRLRVSQFDWQRSAGQLAGCCLKLLAVDDSSDLTQTGYSPAQ